MYGHVTKLFLELELQHKGNKQMKKGLIVSKLLWFSRQERIQKIKLFRCYTEKDKNENWTDLSLLGQEPTFKWRCNRHYTHTRPRGYKTFFMLNSVEHEISNARRYKNIKKFGFY